MTRIARWSTGACCALALWTGCESGQNQPAPPALAEKPAAVVAAPAPGAEAPPGDKAPAPAKLEVKVDGLRPSTDHELVGGSCTFKIGEGETQYGQCPGANFYVAKVDFGMDLAIQAAGADTVEFAGQKVAFSQGQARLHVDLREALGDVLLSSDVGPDDKPIGLSLEIAAGEVRATTTVELAREPLGRLLASAGSGPVRFKRDRRSPGGHVSLFAVGGYRWRRMGAMVHVRELDLVGVITVPSPRQVGKCTYANAAGERKTVPLLAGDIEASVYERRSGKRLGKKVFTARTPTCDEWIKRQDQAVGTVMDEDAAYPWMERFLAKDWEKLHEAREAKDLAGEDEGWEVQALDVDKLRSAKGIDSFWMFAGVKHGDTIDTLFKKLGRPKEIVKAEETGPSASDTAVYLQDALTVDYSRRTRKIEGFFIMGDEAVKLLKAKGVDDPRLDIVGMAPDKLLELYGKPSKIEGDDHQWDLSDEATDRTLSVSVSCSQAEKSCFVLSITWL
jgi:hypothetical protein